LLLPYFIILIINICIAATNIQNFVSGCLERFPGKEIFLALQLKILKLGKVIDVSETLICRSRRFSAR